jgi:hypothetical protein
MRASAQIVPIALRINLQVLPLGNRIDQFNLVDFTLIGKNLPRFFARPDLLGERLVAGNDFPHFLFDHRQIFRREGLVLGKIVIKAVLDDRANGDLRAGEKLLYRFCKHMRTIVTDEFQRTRVFACQDFNRARSAERIGQIAHGAVDGISDCFLGE